ncbi:flagellar biosynthetic protein FliR [Planctellipticum variicoloris]|uniref:flagellar biosynthetic protein FliR n=1 Tax=Planctellipticum variicoloris TaxID=3064265 RepID=UPI0030134290|nr:flagellar biosynthetic protein FliR [Planctomycetaceae bacterium SH412]
MLQPPAIDRLQNLAWQLLLPGAVEQFHTFILVLLRLSGLLFLGPIFGQSTIPPNVRILIIMMLAMIITPTLNSQARRGFERLDENGDGRLVREEVPPGLEPRFDTLQQAAHLSPDIGLAPEEYHVRPVWPTSWFELAWVAAGEISFGLMLGLGVTAILSGLQIAGQLIDQQSGFGLGEVFNPDLQTSGSITGQMLYMLGTAVFLMLDSVGGHLQMVRIMVETFQTFPPGTAFVSHSSIDLLRELVRQSLVIGVRIAAPVMVLMSLIDLTVGFLSHTVPQINVQTVGFALRAMLSFLFLAATLGGLGESVWDFLPETLDHFGEVLVLPES